MKSKSTIKRGLDILFELEKLICFSETVGKTLNNRDLYWKIDYANRYLEMDDYPVQQYTGLKDKNGKEICEGDIVFKQDTEQTLLVYFEMGSFWLGRVEEEKKGFKYAMVWHDRVEVIGNIFENPEFLENA